MEHENSNALPAQIALLNSMPFIIWSARPDGDVDFSNRHFFKFTGVAEDAPVSTRWLPCLHPDDVESCLAMWKECVRDETPFDIEYRLRRGSDGEYRWFRVRAEPVRDAGGKLLKWYGSAIEIHDSKCLELEAKRVADRLTTTLESLTDAFFTLDQQWHFTYVNGESERLLMHSREEMLGIGIWEIFPEAVGTAFQQNYERALTDGVTVGFEEYYPPLKKWFEVRAYPSEEGLAVYFHDSTARKNHEQAIEQALARLNEAQRIGKIGDWQWNIEDRVIAWSPQVFGIAGRDPRMGPPRSYEEFEAYLDAPSRVRMKDAVEQVITLGESREYEMVFVRPGGERVEASTLAVPRKDESGRVVSMYGTIQDITERKRAERELDNTNRALRTLSACNEILIRAEDEAELLHGICRIGVEIGGFPLAWVGHALNDSAKAVVPLAHAGVEGDYLANLRITWDEDDPLGRGPAGRAIRSGKPIVIPNLEEYEDFQPWLEKAKACGFSGVIALPLRNARKTFGVLVLYLSDHRIPLPDEIRVLQELANDMAFGIVNIRTRIDRQRIQSAVVKVASAVSAATGHEFFEQLTRTMAEALGAQAAFVAELLPGKPLRARTITAVADGQLRENFEYALEDTPCERFLTSDTCIIDHELTAKFPKSRALFGIDAQGYAGRRLDSSTGRFLGIIFVIFRDPLEDEEFISSMLRIFAARAASELERQATDAQVHEQAALLDKARDAIVVRDLDHRILYWNRSAERLYGWSSSEVLGRSIKDLLYNDPTAFITATKTVLENREWVGEITQITKEGRKITVEGRWNLVTDAEGNPKSILAINTDITDRKRMEQQFLRAQRMESIGTLAGGIAHDLNNVLAPIMMSIELLKIGEKSPNRLEMLSIIDGSARRGADMVTQVLSFARGVEGQQLEVNVGNLLREIERMINDIFLKNIHIECNVAPELKPVSGDPTQLHQVLLNLCVNARDAMPDGGKLTLSAGNRMIDDHYAGMNLEAKPGQHVVIEVEDNGTGIPPKLIDRIFEPFFTTKEIGKGTGLGLSTSIAIIKSHGGFIRVYSELGTGTRIQVYLPALPESKTLMESTPTNELPRGRDELILVVDDEAAVRQITRQTLEAFGYRVITAADGAEATAIYATRQTEISVVITDMMMPIMDGPATIVVLLRMNPDVRIIAASGLNANGMVAKATNAGVTHFLPKPYTAETLLVTLREVIEKPGP